MRHNMKELLSKELYIEVMNIKDEFERYSDYYEKGVVDSFYQKDNTLYMTIFYQSKQDVKGRGEFSPFNINIYELAHKCKEWALKNGYKLHDYAHSIVIVNLNMNIEYSVIDDNFNNVYDVERFFKACEWIMEQTK